MLTVVCKATFALQPVESPLADAQDSVVTADRAWEGDERGSLRDASELVPFKRGVDVVVVGHAHAPEGQAITSLVARLVVGAHLSKAIEVHGDRSFSPEGELLPAAPFTRMPLRWERAAGGPGTWNPVGVPASTHARGPGPVPNLLPWGVVPRTPADRLPPAGLGPLSPTWPERASALGQHAAGFRHAAWAECPLPDDIDVAYFNVAPPDQRLDRWRGDELLLLEHLHPEHAVLATRLVGVSPRAIVKRGGEPEHEVQLRCDTLVIDADRGVCALTWRGAVPLRHVDEEGVVLVTMDPPEGAEERSPGSTRPPVVRPPEAGAATPALPFVLGSAQPSALGAASPSALGAPASASTRPAAAAPAHSLAMSVTDPVDMPVERFAAISAEIAGRRAPRADVLRAHGLDEREWTAAERHLRAAIDRDVAAGSNRLQSASDSAYVEVVERLRGPVTLEEYVQIAVALERGNPHEALDALRIQRPALMPIVRIWMQRVTADPQLASRALALMSVMRGE